MLVDRLKRCESYHATGKDAKALGGRTSSNCMVWLHANQRLRCQAVLRPLNKASHMTTQLSASRLTAFMHGGFPDRFGFALYLCVLLSLPGPCRF